MTAFTDLIPVLIVVLIGMTVTVASGLTVLTAALPVAVLVRLAEPDWMETTGRH